MTGVIRLILSAHYTAIGTPPKHVKLYSRKIAIMPLSLSSHHYGIAERHTISTDNDYICELVSNDGFAVIENVLDLASVQRLIAFIDGASEQLPATLTKYDLQDSAEANTIRSPLTECEYFLTDVAAHPRIMNIVDHFLGGSRGFFVLNQQNVIVNTPGRTHRQATWHRDYPYFGAIPSRPIGVSAITCLTDLTSENGATWVLPGSHRRENAPSDRYVDQHAIQVEASAGSVVVFDSMLWHCAGYNKTDNARLIVNTMYSNPLLRQQIDLPAALANAGRRYDKQFDTLLGYRSNTPRSVHEFLKQVSANAHSD